MTVRTLENKDILLISNQSYYDRYWTSKQYITQELVKKNRVLYVDGNYSLGKLFMGLKGGKWPITLFGKLSKKSDQLYIYTPPPRLPLRNHFAWASKLHQRILKNSLQKAAKKVGLKNPIVWSFLHSTNLLVDQLDEDIFVYHCVDDWPRLLPLAGMGDAEQIKADEEAVAKKAGIVFCTAKILKQKFEPICSNVHYFPNAVDTTLFQKALLKETKTPLDLASIGKPVIGFVGSLEKWVDVDLLYRVFKEKTEWSFISVGITGDNSAVKRFNSLPNVHLLGLKPKEALPGYLKTMDVALIPFCITELGKSISPLKLFEYFAAGKPVVAADLPEISQYSDLVWLAATEEDYINGINQALKKKDNPEYLKALKAASEKNSWPERIKSYSSVIAQTKI